MPMLKICTPPPDMYSMNACMGSDFTGEIAKSHAFLVLRSSYEFTAASLLVPVLVLAVIVVVVVVVVVVEDDEDLPDAFPYDIMIMII